MEPATIQFKGGIDVTFLSETPQLNIFTCSVKPEARTPIDH
jgi:hypothetical protein